jgi:flagellar motor switch protein FliG
VDDRKKWDNLEGSKRAAIVLLALGKEASTQVLKNLDDTEVERIAAEIAALGPVPEDVQNKVLRDYTQALASTAGSRRGGIDTASDMLESALGSSKASEVVGKVKRLSAVGSIRKLEQMEMEADTFAEVLKGEHPQIIALVVAQMEPRAAADLLSALPEALRTEVALRIATLETISPEVSEEIGRSLSSQLEGLVKRSGSKTADGTKIIADILNSIDRDTEKEILEVFEDKNPEVAKQVKHLMFVFDDILLLDDRSLQRVLREVDTKELAVALKAADEEIKEKIFKNMSERAANMIKEEIEYMGPKRLSEVEEAQQKIMEAVRSLEESGEIVMPGRGGDAGDVIV